MATFKDNKGRDWEIAIDAPKIMALRADCDPKFLLNDDDQENTFSRLQADPVLLCRAIFVLCKKQRETREITEEEFYLDVIGDAIDAATDAMLQAIINFTPRRTRELLELSAAKANLIRQRATDMALDRINDPQLVDTVVQRIGAEMDAKLQELTRPSSATNAPASAASAPTG
jgi:hypothetical protein